MGLDKTGFTLLDNELKERKKQIRDQYQKKKTKEIARQTQNLLSNGEQRKLDIKNIEANYDKANFSKEVEERFRSQEQAVFEDWGGSRGAAAKTMSGYEQELESDKKPESKEDFKARMKAHSAQKQERGKDQGHN